MNADNGPAAFFNALSKAFGETLDLAGRQPDLIGRLCVQAFDSFEKNVAIQAEGAPAIACQGECAACCTLRVVATAPEVFLMARFIAVNENSFLQRDMDIRARIAQTDAEAGGLSERARMSLRCDCPFIENGLCLAYRVRPLACRGHASFDKEACEKAALGEETVEAAVSTPHLMVRSLVQNAMMSALRNAGLAFRPYELIGALNIALASPEALANWLAGEDPLSSAAIAEFNPGEAGSAFDAIAKA
jgi:Fe-S-cluster containining protein